MSRGLTFENFYVIIKLPFQKQKNKKGNNITS